MHKAVNSITNSEKNYGIKYLRINKNEKVYSKKNIILIKAIVEDIKSGRYVC